MRIERPGTPIVAAPRRSPVGDASTGAEADILVIQHVRCEPPATYEDVLTDYGLTLHRVLIDEGEALPDLHRFAAMIVMGGPMGALDDHAFPWLKSERAYISEAIALGMPYWGVCLGAQLLAASLGADVYAGPVPEVGKGSVRLSPGALNDPVFGNLAADFSVFQWHADTFDLPTDARRLASSEQFANQAFAVDSAYGVQFHVEVGPELAIQWSEIPAYREALDQIYGGDGMEAVIADLADLADDIRQVAVTIFSAWLDTFVIGTTVA